MEIWFVKEAQETNTGGRTEGDSWSRDSTSTSWHVGNKLFTSKPKDHWSYEQDDVPDDTLKSGDVVYLAYVVYSTGDSFGNDRGAGFEVIGFYKTAELAYQATKAIDNGPKEYDFTIEPTGNSVEVPTYDGTNTRLMPCGSWCGYFESLDATFVQQMTVV